jgi:carboxyl-terminal processing protease
VRRWLGLAAVVLLPSALAAGPVADKAEDLRFIAAKFEKAHDWARACTYYAYLLGKDPNQADVRERLQTCLRHYHRVRRHQDASFRQQVLTLDLASALKLYGEVLGRLQAEYVEEEKVALNRLFHRGLEELRLALEDETFRRAYAPDAKPQSVRDFLTRLKKTWGSRVVRYPLDAQNQTLQVALAARTALGLRPTVAVLEIACGACNSLDEFTYYLTPRQFLDENAVLKGETVGVGVDVTFVDKKLIVWQVYINSPAAGAGLKAGDQITRIDKQPAAQLTPEAVLEKLKGPAGTAVELEVIAGAEKPRVYSLIRQAIRVSVTDYRMVGMGSGIGYVQLATFHENTPREFDEALRQLDMQGLRALILDLRGNGGGRLDVAIRVAERFLEEGAPIVSTRGRGREVKRLSHNVSPLAWPLVVLVDGGTASAAEVLAGALKENARATLIGQATYGKSTIQHLVELKAVPAGGVWVTWARFYSPLSRTPNEGGITPHVLIERSSLMFDEPLQAALQLLAGRSQ